MSAEKKEKLSPELEPLLAFKVPEIKDVKAYIVRLADGRIVARTEEELEELKKPKKGKE